MASIKSNFDQKCPQEEKEQETHDEGKYNQLDFLYKFCQVHIKVYDVVDVVIVNVISRCQIYGLSLPLPFFSDLGSVWSNLHDVSRDIPQVHDDI